MMETYPGLLLYPCRPWKLDQEFRWRVNTVVGVLAAGIATNISRYRATTTNTGVWILQVVDSRYTHAYSTWIASTRVLLLLLLQFELLLLRLHTATGNYFCWSPANDHIHTWVGPPITIVSIRDHLASPGGAISLLLSPGTLYFLWNRFFQLFLTKTHQLFPLISGNMRRLGSRTYILLSSWVFARLFQSGSTGITVAQNGYRRAPE